MNNNSYHHQPHQQQQLNMNNINNANLNNQPQQQQQQQQNYFNNNGGGGGGGSSKKGIIIVRATHEYLPVNNDELHIRPGDIITIINPEEGGWWEGSLDNQTGWFPSNYVTTVAIDSTTVAATTMQQPPMSPNQQQQQQPSSLSMLSTTTGGDGDEDMAVVVGVGGGGGGGREGNNQRLQLLQQSDEYKKIILNEMVEEERRFVGEMEEFYERFLGGGAGGFLSNNNMEASSPPPTSPQDSPTIKTQLRQAYNNIIQTHKTHLLNPLQSHVTQILHNPSSPSATTDNLRIGKLFLTAATHLELAYNRYCSLHPRFVQFVEKSHQNHEEGRGEDATTTTTATTTTMNPVVLQMIASLSAPFRRIERYGHLLNELDCHVESYHGDKGDMRRSVQYYRAFEKSLTALRKQKEMELEVLTANPSQIKELEGPDISTLGEILLMNLLYQGREREPRYFVLFPTTILILAYDTADSSFTYKGRVQIGGITTVTNVVGSGGRRGSDNSNGRRDGGVDDEEDIMNAFEIAGPTLHPILIQCPTPRVKQQWLQNLNDVIRATTRCCSYPTTTPSPSSQQQQLAQQHQQFPHHHSSTSAITGNSGLPPQAPQHHPHHQHHNSSNMNNNSGSSSTLLLTPQIQAWNITRLRPSPPYNPFLAEYQQQGQQQQQNQNQNHHYRGSGSSGGLLGGRSSSGRSISGSGGGGFSFGKTGSFSGFSSSSSVATTGVSNEDDFAVLSIVDGFCVRGGSGRGAGNMGMGHNSSSNILLRTDPANRSLRSLQDYHFNPKNNNHTSSSSRPQSPSSVFLSPTTTVPSLSKQQQQQQSSYNNNVNNNNIFPRLTTTPPTAPTPLHQMVKYLRDDITSLNERIGSLTKQLDEEKEARGELANIVMGVTRMLRPSISTTGTLDEEQINNNT